MLTSYRTSPQQNLWLDEIIVDNFAGGGGVCPTLSEALVRASYSAEQIRKAA
jgi:DNA (cytosine-5)-methyltransferase 1